MDQTGKFATQSKSLQQDLHQCFEDIYDDPDIMAKFCFELRRYDAIKGEEREKKANTEQEGIVYENLHLFSWSQEDKNVEVKITNSLVGIGQLPKELITCDFDY